MTCSIDGCDRPKKTRGMCGMHAERVRDGRPLHSPPRINSLAKPFDHWVAPAENGCHEWQGPVNSSGYGRYGVQYAHRISYTLHKGPIPVGLHIDHLCRNPLCVNPAHLEAVTPQVNLARSFAPNALAVRTNRCFRGHEFTPENTYFRPDGAGRQCRECNRLRRQSRQADAA